MREQAARRFDILNRVNIPIIVALAIFFLFSVAPTPAYSATYCTSCCASDSDCPGDGWYCAPEEGTAWEYRDFYCSGGSCNYDPSSTTACPTNAYCTGGSCYNCILGYLDCNNNWANGCEVWKYTDNNNCGSCGNKCDTTIGKVCSVGECVCSVPNGADCNKGSSDRRSCGTDVGECVAGGQYRYCTSSCTWGSWESCLGSVGPSPEVCDAKDNDCDNSVDERSELCGNGNAESDCGETCDWGTSFCGAGNGNDPSGSTCTTTVSCPNSYPSVTGKYRCNSGCSGYVYDTSSCGYCGDGAVNGPEVCDPQGSSCTTTGGNPGTCASGCGSCEIACTDSDGDGRYLEGGACGSADCNDNNANVYQYLNGYVDSDRDGYTVGSVQSVCSGASLPAGYSATSTATDCNDANAAVYQLLNGYVDSDKDGYGAGSVQSVCSGASLPSGYSSVSGDCDDANAFVNPGANENSFGTCRDGLDDDCDGQIDCADSSCNGVACNFDGCSSYDTKCREYSEYSYCTSGVCPPTPACGTSGYASVNNNAVCGSYTRTCTAGANTYCSSGNIWADTDADKSCTAYCSSGNCGCALASCDTALWQTCSDACSGETSPSYLSGEDTVTDYELCQAGQTSCPSTALKDACTGSVLTEYYCSGADAVGVDKDCNDYDNPCTGTCGTGADSCTAIDYVCAAGSGAVGGSCQQAPLVDVDGSSGLCSGCSAQGTVWSTGGETVPFGEYDAGTSTECCGDDSNEKYRSTAKGASTYSACCDSATDCVDSGNVCVPSGTMSGGFKCASGQWVDGDVSAAACAQAGGSWSIGGEVAATTCCSDDAAENVRFRECAVGACVSNTNDNACCDADADCVFSDQCYYDINAAIAGVQVENAAFCGTKPNLNACTSGESKQKCQWTGSACVAAATRAAVQFSQQSGGSYAAYADVDSDGSYEVCVAASPGKWEGTSGSIAGFVRNVSTVNSEGPCPPAGCPVAGAVVKVLGTGLSAATAADGSYTIANVPSGSYDIAASKTAYEANTVLGLLVPDGETATANFVLVQSLGSCEDDCTTVGSNLCDASCHGKGLCWFSSDATRQACDGTFGLIEMPNGQYVDCCTGKAYTPLKAEVSVPAENVVITRKPVLYKGKFVNMVIVVFRK